MSNIKGAVILFFLFAVGIAAYKFGYPVWQEHKQRTSSDAGQMKGTIRLALDNWIGYYILQSQEMKRLMRNSGWNLVVEDDKADYAKREEKLRKKEIDLAVATVDSDILNGAPKGFPGVWISVIDESKGGDAILSCDGKVQNLNAIKGKTDLKIAFTPSSPSHHLLKATADHFGIPELLVSGANRLETDGSGEALKSCLNGKADLAVLWEPDVSRALEEGKGRIVKLLGTESTERLIVDILTANRAFVDNNPEAIKTFLSNYFLALKLYRDQPELLKKEIIEETKLSGAKLSPDAVDKMLKGVKWMTLEDNARLWFGVSAAGERSEDGLLATAESTVRILLNSKDFSKNPIPEGNPARLINSKFIEELYKRGTQAGFTIPGAKTGETIVGSLEAKFLPLDEAGWSTLRDVGTLKIRSITFQRSSSTLTEDGKEELNILAEQIKHYPAFRMSLTGHTVLSGDPTENKKLSQERVEAVAKYLEVTFNVDPNRMRALGLGSNRPLTKLAGETDESYSFRLPRVEITLLREVL